MGQELPENLDALRSMASQLNAATAEAGAVISAVEQYLGEEICIGVSGASPPFDSQRAIGDGEREHLVTSHLAFGRVSGRDRIFVLKATLEKTEWTEHFSKVVAEDHTPWDACSREVKLQSFAMLPALLGNLAARVEEVAAQTSRTVQTVRELLDAIRQAPPAAELEPPPSPGEGVSLHELTASSAPDLFKRPRAKATTGNGNGAERT
jgi:hypothetical protein